MELVTASEERARQALITFLSLLELGKMGFVRLYQREAYADIRIDTQKPIETDVLSRVEEYDSMRADQVAEKMMEDSKKIAAEDELLAEEEELETAQMSLDDLALGQDIAQAGDILEGESVDFAMNDLASDDEILAAENELFKDEVTEV